MAESAPLWQTKYVDVEVCKTPLAPLEVDIDDLNATLHRQFGLESFRRGQLEIITSVLAGHDTMAVMPTGGGKSLCYQFPAMYLTGVVLVISPLIALMRDQVAALEALGLPAGCVHSGQTEVQKRDVFARLEKSDSFVLYLSPERVQKEGFAKWFQKARVSLVAIDESHCVSQWGHDFRQDYIKLESLRKWRPDVPILATTATATPQVLGDMSKQLGLREPKRHVFGFYRPNLYYQVEFCSDDAAKLMFLSSAVEKFSSGRILVYCGTRKKTEAVAAYLSDRFKGVSYYHAGLANPVRNEVQEMYERGETRILVATNAFGMGVDLPDVRLVIHHQLPANIDSYYQEMGRAGRDGHPSTCLLLYARKDKGLQSFFIQQSKAPPWIINAKWKQLDAIVQYAEGGECRHSGILTYFRDEQRIDECGHCDVCQPEVDRRVVLSAVTGSTDRLRIQEEGRSFEAAVSGKPKKKSKSRKRKKAIEVAGAPLTEEEKARVKILRDWRLQFAKSKDLPAFMIFSNKTLEDLARKNPASLTGLESVYGIGSQKIEAFGQLILDELRNH